MNENNLNELTPENGAPSEAQRRAEKINAIKNSMRSNQQTSEPVQVNAPEPEVTAPQAQETVADEWESEIAARIAKRVQQMKNKKSGETDTSKNTDNLIEEIDRILSEQEAEAAEENSIAEEELQEIPQNEEIAQSEEVNDDSQDAACESGYAPADYQEETPVQEDAQEADAVSNEEADDAALIQEADKPAEKQKAENKKSKKKKKKKKKKTVGQTLLGLLPNKKDKIGERLRKVVFLGSIVAIIVCGYIVSDYYIGNYLTENRYKNVMDIYDTYPVNTSPKVDTDPDDGYDGPFYELLPGAQKLLDINEDVVGIIRIPGTEVNYPIVQSDDLEKYLHLDFTGKEARAGSIFLDYRCRFDKVIDGRLAEPNSDNQIIYGHNMADEMMFGSLRNYKEYDYYYGEHPIVELNSNYQTYTYKIFAFFLVDADDKTETAFDCWNNINFPTEEEFYDFVNEAKRRTLRLNDVDVKYGDKLLTLSTCNSIFGTGGSGRFIVLAREVREGEDPYEGTQNSTENTNIKWPSLYYKYKNATYDPDAEFIPYGPDDSKADTEADDESSAEE